MTTLRDVAKAAHVDISTVSRVLRDDPRQSVREETRQRILAAAARLDYRPDAIARSLRSGKTRTVALLVPDLDNIGFSQIIKGAGAAATENQYMLLLANAPDDEQEHLLHFDGRVDGLLVASAHLNDQQLPVLQRQRVPIVLVNRRAGRHLGSVVVDDAAGTEVAMQHLFDYGHRRVAHVAGEMDTDTARRKLQAYRKFLADRSLHRPRKWVAPGDYTIEGGRRAALQLHANGAFEQVTAIYAANLASALGVLEAITERGYDVPGQISVIAMDDHVFASHTNPPLTTVAMPLYEMGYEAMLMMINAVEGEAVHNQVVDIPPLLRPRASVRKL